MKVLLEVSLVKLLSLPLHYKIMGRFSCAQDIVTSNSQQSCSPDISDIGT